MEQAFFQLLIDPKKTKKPWWCCPFYTIAVQCAQTEVAKKVNDYELNS